jgi:hypothetical protein
MSGVEIRPDSSDTRAPVAGVAHDGRVRHDGGPEAQADRPVRPCIQCREPVTFDGQPGDATCPACGVGQYLTAPSRLYPQGGQGRHSTTGKLGGY